ncbi:hypothetical protein P4O66_005101 [Electrophorus voltai]|uniref:Beta-1,4-galactosyltransferase n=1 Tax=Electrophorus voltai TaxID=2609070 RepID=A0AAD9E9B5_9TELE|nr:hypothetical protein P4O66_005101 [Electrophorus voltai]
MPSLNSKWRYLIMLLGVQLIVMALLAREGYQKKVTYFFRLFRKLDTLSGQATGAAGHGQNRTGADVYTNLSHLIFVQNKEDMPYCPKTSPLTGVNLAHLLINISVALAGNYTFNRAKLMNVGFREAMREADWDCLFFHDVDLIPENDRNTYTCDQYPKHAAVAMDKFGYKSVLNVQALLMASRSLFIHVVIFSVLAVEIFQTLTLTLALILLYPRLPYNMYFGGVSALTPLHYLKMNGFPNNYWGWGGEDDDIGIRVSLAGMVITRPSLNVGRYKMIKHKLDEGNEVNPKRFNMLAKTKQTWKLDGMNSLEYEVLSREYLPLYTNITVNIGIEEGAPANPHTQLEGMPKEVLKDNQSLDN